MIRNWSGSQAVTPGLSRLIPGVVMSNVGNDPLPQDVWLNQWAPDQIVTLNLVSGANQYQITDTTNTRFIQITMPPDNAVACQIGFDGPASGKYINPNGVEQYSFDPNNPESTIYFTAAGTISNVSLYVG